MRRSLLGASASSSSTGAMFSHCAAFQTGRNVVYVYSRVRLPLEPSALESPVIASSSASAPSAGRDPLTVRMMQIQWPCSPRRTWPPAALICWNPAHRWSS